MKPSKKLRFAIFGLLITGSSALINAQPAVVTSPKQNIAAEGGWNAFYLHKPDSEKEVNLYKQEYEVNMATAGYLYSVPPFLHYRQRYEFLRNFQLYMGDKGNPFGQFLLLRHPATHKTQDPMANVDTLYGATFLELSKTPMVLVVPPIPDRYFSFALVDAYFYNFDYIGSRTTGQQGGKYLIVGPNWQGKKPKGIDRIIHAPTNSINVYQRIYFKNGSDIAVVNRIQDSIKLLPLEKFQNPSATVALPNPADYTKLDPLNAKDPWSVLKIANTYMGENPPPISDLTFTDYFAPLGIGPGLILSSDKVVRANIGKGAEQADHAMSALALTGFPVKNGWQIPPPNVGEHGGAGGVAMQAMIQVRSIGINSSKEAVYYNAYADAELNPLSGKNSYSITFAKNQIPPVDKARYGFWSLTIYDRTNARLIENAANKYSIRSADDLVYNSDGSLTLYVQPKPPTNKALIANWLPSDPKGDFILALRVYLGGKEVASGSYVPAPIVKTQ
jgi:hypothetical protein